MHLTFEEITQKEIGVVQLLRTGNFDYAGRKLAITAGMLREMKLNFDSDVRRGKLAVDYFHESGGKAAGWITGIELRDNDQSLWIKVDWTENAKTMILGKELKYLSAEFSMGYKDNETGKKHGVVLFGAGLTNRPFVRDMKALLSECNQEQLAELKEFLNNPKNEDKIMPIKKLMEDIKNAKLSDEDKAALAKELGVELSDDKDDAKAKAEKLKLAEDAKADKKAKEDAEAKLSENEKERVKLHGDITALQAVNAKAEKTAKFDAMLADGKAVEGQREAYMGDDMAKFAENAVNVNLAEQGDGQGGSSKTEEAEQDKALAEIFALAEKRAEKEDISLHEASKAVGNENPSLMKVAYGE